MSQTPTTSIPYNGSGTINIHINNPSACLGNSMPYQAAIPCNYPYYCYPANYYLQTPNNGINQITNINNPNSAEKLIVKKSNDNTTKQTNNKQSREIVVLTNDYIKNLENYLRNNNAELRKQAVKELLLRFKEDKSRLENPSLTGLLNLALQDTNSIVRTLAMSIITSGYAKGNDITSQLLKQLQNNKSNYSLDAIQASDALLQMSKNKKTVTDNSHYIDQKNNSIKKG